MGRCLADGVPGSRREVSRGDRVAPPVWPMVTIVNRSSHRQAGVIPSTSETCRGYICARQPSKMTHAKNSAPVNYRTRLPMYRTYIYTPLRMTMSPGHEIAGHLSRKSWSKGGNRATTAWTSPLDFDARPDVLAWCLLADKYKPST